MSLSTPSLSRSHIWENKQKIIIRGNYYLLSNEKCQTKIIYFLKIRKIVLVNCRINSHIKHVRSYFFSIIMQNLYNTRKIKNYPEDSFQSFLALHGNLKNNNTLLKQTNELLNVLIQYQNQLKAVKNLSRTNRQKL